MRLGPRGWSMSRKRAAFFATLALAMLAAEGCSTKAWYEGMKLNAQNECRRQPPGDSESCLARVNTMPYEDYERNRLGKGKSGIQ